MIMHSRIIELTDEEHTEDEWMCFFDIPEWFYGPIADYAIESEDRDEDLNWLRESLEGSAELEGNKLTFRKDAAVRHFAGRYEAFVQQMADIQSVTLEEFAGVSGNFSLQMHTLNSFYNDEFDFYIYHNNSFMTLDEWIREADLTHPFFVGRTFDYHY